MAIRPSYLADHGRTLIENGYLIIPIAPGSKAPPEEGWQRTRSTPTQLQQWLSQGFDRHGIGILTEHFPSLDVDTLDPELAKRFTDWCDDNIAIAPIRVGRWPKTLLLFRTEEPFYKKFSSEWVDNPVKLDLNGKPAVHRLEVLGRGQQFVAYAIHKDTKKPYEWTSDQSPLNTASSNLPTITAAEADRACAAFDEIAEEMGLQKRGRTRSRAINGAAIADWTADVATKVGYTADKIRETLAQIPNEDDESVSYDDWLQVGMGVFHETDGSDEGFDMWEYWSERSYKHSHAEAEKKWQSFAIEGKGRAPITFRFAMKLASESQQAVREAVSAQIKTDFEAAKTKAAFMAVARRLQDAELDNLERDAFVPVVTKSYERIYGAKMLVSRARQTVRATPRSLANKPDWMAPYVFNTEKNEFFDLETKQAMVRSAFDHVYDRYIMTPAERAAGKTMPDTHAADMALNVFQIAPVAGVRYCPWEEQLFSRDGKLWANAYSDALVPVMPEVMDAGMHRAVRTFQRHLEHLIVDDLERELFLDWLCHVVRTGHRCNWCVVMLGCEGDGKTWFLNLMSRILGGPNVTIASAASIQDRFNAWAENAQLVGVEEIRFVGHNRYDIMNQLKPLITNETIEIHRKNQTQYNTVNTAQYLMCTNHADALPVDDATSRYFIIRTRWQQRTRLKEFQEANPDYYAELADLLDYTDGVAAIRNFMLQKTPHPEFSAEKRAPDSEGKTYMARVVRGADESILLDEVERGTNPLLCRTLVCTAEAQAFLQQMTGEFPRPDAIGRFLRRAEFESLGQIRVGKERHSFWSTTPNAFQHRRRTISGLVTKYIDRTDLREV